MFIPSEVSIARIRACLTYSLTLIPVFVTNNFNTDQLVIIELDEISQ